MHREKCRCPVRPASGAPVFANGAVTTAIGYVYNQVLSEQRFDTREEAIEAQLEKAKRVHATFNKSRSSRIRRTRGKQPGSETGFDRQPIGGFIFKKKSFFSRDVSFRVTLRIDIAQAAGFIDAFAEGAPRDAIALAVFTNPEKDQRLDFSSVSSNLDGTPVFVEIPDGTVFQFTPKGCPVFRGDSSCD